MFAYKREPSRNILAPFAQSSRVLQSTPTEMPRESSSSSSSHSHGHGKSSREDKDEHAVTKKRASARKPSTAPRKLTNWNLALKAAATALRQRHDKLSGKELFKRATPLAKRVQEEKKKADEAKAATEKEKETKETETAPKTTAPKKEKEEKKAKPDEEADDGGIDPADDYDYDAGADAAAAADSTV